MRFRSVHSRIGLVIALLLALPAEFAAENRTALLMANGNYASFGTLATPVPEARALKAALAALDFTTTLVENASREGMVDACRNSIHTMSMRRR